MLSDQIYIADRFFCLTDRIYGFDSYHHYHRLYTEGLSILILIIIIIIIICSRTSMM